MVDERGERDDRRSGEMDSWTAGEIYWREIPSDEPLPSCPLLLADM
jgi:hypothetical protein